MFSLGYPFLQEHWDLTVIFFYWVGLSVDLNGMVQTPMLAVLLYLAATIGKLIGVFVMVPMGKITWIEGWTVGIGLNARLTTEIVVAKLLLDAKLINIHLFTALVAASSLSTLAVPLLFTLIARQWGSKLHNNRSNMVITTEVHANRL